MKKILVRLFVYGILFTTIFYFKDISSFIAKRFIQNEPRLTEAISIYKKEDLTSFVQNTDSFIPYSYQDLLNIIYTTINNGWNNFTFFCGVQYEACVNDAIKISNDKLTLAHINNFTHPYNTYSNLRLTIADSGEININVDYLYQKDMINEIDTRVDVLIKELLNDSMDDYTVIKTIHDHIINTTKYDVEKHDSGKIQYKSEMAYGPLFEGFANCNGYTDLMAIFLEKLNYKNFKISVLAQEMKDADTGHVWNMVYYNNAWKHLDLTWDDPVDPTGRDRLEHNYFLISSDELKRIDTENQALGENHTFNKYIYYDIN